MDPRHVLRRFSEIARYYQAGAINAGVGFGLYSFFVWLSFNIFIAQILSHMIGVTFNYFTYSRHVFRNRAPAKMRFVISYGANYVLSLAILVGVSTVEHSPYVAGLVTIILTSVINYFALKHLVFVRGLPL